MDETEEADSLVRAVAAAPARVPATQAGPLPARIGRFVIQKQVGAGGMGVVYQAVDPDLGRKLAVKLIRPRDDEAQRASASARLLREAQAMAQLAHPNVVPIFEVGNHDGSVYLAMEYIEGETLRQWMHRSRRAWTDTLECFLQAAAGLTAAHTAGLIHRDFKPENVLRGHDGRVRVLDFGLARLFHREPGDDVAEPPSALATDLTQHGAVVGTPLYMAPEQHSGEAATAKTDQFSFCVALWEALYGTHPFRGDTHEELVQAITAGVADPARRDAAPESVLAVLKRGLAANPADRFPSMAALAITLDNARVGGSEPPTRRPQVRNHETDSVVGYVTERRLLSDALTDVEAGRTRAIVLAGDAGIGKSTLLADFIAHARRSETLLVTAGGCDEQHGAGEAYLPFLEAISRLASGTARSHVRSLLQEHAPMWSLRMSSLDFSTQERAALRGETEGATPVRMRRELCELVRELSYVSPVVLAFEDFHWTDASSLALLQELIGRVQGCRVMIVLTTRTRETLGAADGVTTIELRGLSRADVDTYLDQRFAPNRFASTFRDTLHERCHGNPLVMRSILELATARGVVRRDGTYWVALPAFDLESDTLQVLSSVIDARLQGVSATTRAVLDCAAVAGEGFNAALLANALDISEHDASQQLARLDLSTRLVMLETERADADATRSYRFAHARYRAALYDAIPPASRRKLHARLAAALATFAPEDVREHAARIAQHLDAAGDGERAAHAYVDAANAAVERLAYPEAEAHVRRALELLGRSGEISARGLSLRVRCAELRAAYGQFRDVIRETSEIAAQANQLGEAVLESAARRELCGALFFASQIPELVVATQEALECAERVGDEIERARALVPLALVHMTQGEIRAARDALAEGVRVGRRSAHRALLSPALAGTGTLDFFQSNYSSAERVLDEAYETLQTSPDRFMTANARFFLALSLGNLGRIDRALALLHKGLKIAERNDDAFWAARIPNCIGWLHTEVGAYAEARAHNLLTIRRGRSESAPEPLANGLVNFALTCAYGGDHAAALAALAEANQLCMREGGLRWRYDMRHKHAMAECALARRDLDTLGDAARTLLTCAHEYGARKYVVDAHRLLAEGAVRSGHLDEARRQLADGIAALGASAAPLVEWRLHAAALRVHTAAGDIAAADVARAQLEQVIEGLVTNVSDPALQQSLRQRVAAMVAAP